MRAAAILLATILAPASAFVPPADELRIGIGVVDITGPEAVILDPLHAKAVYFSQGTEQFALVEVDVGAMDASITAPARRLASEKTGVPSSNICVAATHTHMASQHNELVPAIVEAIARAKAAAKPTRLDAGAGLDFTLSFNRRYYMKDGRVMFNPMFLNPDIVRPAGPIDPELGILLFRDAQSGRPFASLTNFALHLDTVKEYGAKYQKDGVGSANSVSADCPYWLEESLRHSFGADFNSVFATGACGNINQWDFSKPGPQSGHKTTTRHLGESLAKAFIQAVPELTRERPALAVRSRTMRVPLREQSPGDVAWARQFLADKGNASGKSEEVSERQRFLSTVRAHRILAVDKIGKEAGAYILDLQVVRLSDNAAIVTLPGEMFVEHALTIKNLSPFDNTMVVELANDSCGYVPNRKAYPQGEYEVEHARLAPGGGELMVEAAVQLLHQLKTDIR